MRHSPRFLITFTLWTCFVFASGEDLRAQESKSVDSTRSYKMSEVLVTATRASGEVMSIPMAVGIVDLRDFRSTRRFGLDDALNLMPGVLAQSRAGGQDIRLTIRGFGARASGDRSNAATIRGIKVLIDGVPETEPDGRTPLDLIDLNTVERIEVVRSNASTLFGNASGGVLSLQTRSSFNQSFLQSNNTFGSYGLRRNNIAVGSILGAGRLFLSVTSGHYDGWRSNSGSFSTHILAALTSPLDESTHIRVTATGAQNKFSIPGALTQAQFDSDPTQANAAYIARRERRSNQVGRFTAELSKTFAAQHEADVFLFANPKVLARSERNTYRDFNRYHIGGGAVYRFKGAGDQMLHRVTAGVEEAYQDGSILFYNLVNGERGDSLRTNKREGAETFGGFLQSECLLSDKLTLTLGGRYDRQRYIAENFAAGVKTKSPVDEITFAHFTPKAALLYRIGDTHSVYFNVGGGLEAPAFNEVDPPPAISNAQLNSILKPMVSTTIELGTKGWGLLSDGRILRSLSYSLAVFRIGIKNEIVPYNGGAYFFSAGESHRLGVEVAADLDLRHGFSLTSAYTFLDAAYDTYSNDLGTFSGNKVPGIPKTFLSARLRCETEFGLTIDAVMEHIGSYSADDANTYNIASATLFNGSMSYALKLGAFDLRAFFGIKNLGDAKYAASTFINPVGGAFLEPGLPRNLFGGVDVNIEL